MKQLAVLLLLLPIVFANTIDTSQTDVLIERDLAHITNTFTLSSQGIANLTLLVTPDAYDFSATIDGNRTPCLLQSEYARCGSVANGTHQVQYTYRTAYPFAKVADNTIIRYTDRLPYRAKKQQVTLKLPTGYIVPQEQGKEDDFYISPKPDAVYSDGQRIIISWEQEGQELPISAVTRQIGSTVPWFWMLGAALVSAAITAGAILYTRRKPVKQERPKPKKKTVKVVEQPVVPQLIDNEQRVVEFLKQNGEVWQKQIQQATGFSKAKVSRVVRNLEARGVIRKTPYGNTNKIALKEGTNGA